MKSITEYDTRKSFALVLQGPAGSRKSTLALQFPSPAILDCDNNLAGPIRHLKTQGVDLSTARYETIRLDDKGNERAPQDCWLHSAKVLSEFVSAPDVRSIIIDSATTYEFFMHDYLLHVSGQLIQPVGKRQLTQPLWGEVFRLWKEVITKLRYASGKLIVFIAHDKLEKDEITGITQYRIALTGAIQDKLGALVTDVWACDLEEQQGGKHVQMVRTVSDTRHPGLKCSLPLEPRFAVTPDKVKDIFAKL